MPADLAAARRVDPVAAPMAPRVEAQEEVPAAGRAVATPAVDLAVVHPVALAAGLEAVLWADLVAALVAQVAALAAVQAEVQAGVSVADLGAVLRADLVAAPRVAAQEGVPAA